MRVRPRGVAFALHIDIRMKASGVVGGEGTVYSCALFLFLWRI